MNERPLQIGVISPKKEFVDTAQRVARRLEYDIEVEAAIAGGSDAIAESQRMETEGIEVVVCSRGTSIVLRKNIGVPVLTVPTASFQLFQCIQQAKELGRRILLPIYEDRIEGIEELEMTFGVNILALNRRLYDNFNDILIYGKEQGCQVVIGGLRTNAAARKYGLKVVDLTVSPNALAATLEDACTVALSRRKEYNLNLINQTVIESRWEGTLAIDAIGNITNINHAAKTLLNPEYNDFKGKNIKQFLPKAKIRKVLKNGQKMLNQVEKIGEENFVVDYLPIMANSMVTGGIITIRDISSVQSAEHEIRRSLAKGLTAKYSIKDFVYSSRLSKEIVEEVKKLAPYDATILITGESGTGKEILAHSIHMLSQRNKGAFVSINCASIPKDLLESELFGFEEGAFTGSRRGGKIGLFELAHKGTIFLDEIGNTPLELQPRFLRVLQEREVMRIGGDRLIPVDVRLISASNQDIVLEIAAGRFREDLFYRLNVFTLHVPPLRERIEDLPVLVKKLMERKSKRYQLPTFELPESSILKLRTFHWPGNVRQLSNFLEKLFILSEGEYKRKVFDKLYLELINSPEKKEQKVQPETASYENLKRKLRQDDFAVIQAALRKSGLNREIAARQLGVSRSTLWRKMKTLNMI